MQIFISSFTHWSHCHGAVTLKMLLITKALLWNANILGNKFILNEEKGLRASDCDKAVTVLEVGWAHEQSSTNLGWCLRLLKWHQEYLGVSVCHCSCCHYVLKLLSFRTCRAQQETFPIFKSHTAVGSGSRIVKPSFVLDRDRNILKIADYCSSTAAMHFFSNFDNSGNNVASRKARGYKIAIITAHSAGTYMWASQGPSPNSKCFEAIEVRCLKS